MAPVAEAGGVTRFHEASAWVDPFLRSYLIQEIQLEVENPFLAPRGVSLGFSPSPIFFGGRRSERCPFQPSLEIGPQNIGYFWDQLLLAA